MNSSVSPTGGAVPGQRLRITLWRSGAIFAAVFLMTQWRFLNTWGYRLLPEEWRLATIMRQMPHAILDRPGSGAKGDQSYWFSFYYSAFEDRYGFKRDTLEVKLDTFASRYLEREGLAKMERAEALFCSHQFAEAEGTAMWAADEASKGQASSLAQQATALGVAGAAAWADQRYDRALQHYRAAGALVDEQHDPLGWARQQWRVAFILALQGRHEEAAHVYRSVNVIFERELGAVHPDSLMSSNNLANSLGECDQLAEAEAIHRRVLAARETGRFAKENPASLTSRNNLAWILGLENRFAESEKELGMVLAGRMRLLGSEHLDTLQTRADLGNALFRQGKYVEAHEQYSIALAILKRTVGEGHAQTMWVRDGIADLLSEEGKYAAAESGYRSVLAFANRVLGADHPGTLQVRYSLGVSLLYQSKYEEAEKLFNQVIAAREVRLGSNHRDVLAACSYLSLCLEGEGRLKEALPLAQRTEAAWKKGAVPDDPWLKFTISARQRIQKSLSDQVEAASAAPR
jgi:tetratricopeptide (TPR) repeat protein